LGIATSPDASRKARHEFRESPPGKAGFRNSGHLLGGRPPPFNKLLERLAAATEGLALLDRVEQFNRLARQLKQNLL
jgi:hypothetical protein